jgi:2-phospho-L-lactate guanylyltransferase
VVVQAAVLIPVKDFTNAKRRLAPALDDRTRAELARSMARTVITAAHPLPVYVVCDAEEVAAFALGAGAEVLFRPGLGLNGAVADGITALGQLGFYRVVVAHGDLPLATGLDWVARFPGVTLVPDRRDDGTNVMCVPTDVPLEISYGPGSFRRHVRAALALGVPVRVVREVALGWDVDLPDDLNELAWISPVNLP